MAGRADSYRDAGWWTGERLVDRVAGRVESATDSLALVSGSDRLTLGELWNVAGERARELAAAIGPRRRVVLIDLPNETAWMVVFLAVLRAGHVPATVPVTTTAAHLAHLIDLIDPVLVVGGVAAGRLATSEAVHEAVGCPGVATAEGTELTIVAGPPTASRESQEIEVPAGTDHLMFTSSTTGPPKAVSHSDDSLATLNEQFAVRFGLDQKTPIFMPSPLGHSVGAIHGARLALYLGAPLILQDHWDPGVALDLISEHEAVFTAAATPFLLDLANAKTTGPDPKLKTVRTFLCGGTQVPPALIRRCREELPNTFVTPLWGMTEGGLTTCLDSSSPEQVETTVGTGLPDLELVVLDDCGQARGEGEGELAMRGPGVFNGYYAQPDLYAESITSDGFFRTGDLAAISADGYVQITGRLKDLIVRGAVNISPVETENTLAGHPDVKAVAVIGWPDERLGERLCAAVDTEAGLTLDEVLDYCRASGLPRRLWPERLELVEEFPRTAAGKIRKQQLRQRLLARSETGVTSAGGGMI